MFSANSSENVDFVAAILLGPVYMPQILLHNPKSLFISTYVQLSYEPLSYFYPYNLKLFKQRNYTFMENHW